MSEDAYPVGTPLEDLDHAGVMARIPHRYPMLLVDRVVELEAFKRAVGIKNVTHNEPFFPGHFPTDPIMPGVLIIESLAQTAAVLASSSLGARAHGSLVYFSSVEEARFRRPVRPGHQLRLEVLMLRYRMGVFKYQGRAMVAGELATEASFSAKVITG
jgi:3-hydroxyacyl-[acyl-carrier-protein] dehydratase